ncbi:MAG TPA: DUF4397 domain-containing protein [Chitinophagaceae bacterium]|nr:DUF4397 domain-containing protein [Chitinophagaceae bacterium]
MRMVFSNFRRNVMVGLALAAVTVFTACKKDKVDTPDIPAAALMAFNLSPDQQSVVVTLSGNMLTNRPLGYTSYTGIYQNIYTGTRTVQAYDYPDNNPLATTEYTFDDSTYYSLFVVGANDKYRNVISVDKFDELNANSGNAYIRYVNGITDSVNMQNVTITAAGSSVANDNAAYAGVSEFKAVAPGEVTITVKGNGVDATRTISVGQKNVYTVLLTGVPGATDETSKVQIRFIQNGTLTDEAGGK